VDTVLLARIQFALTVGFHYLAIVGIEVFNRAGAARNAFVASALSIAALFGAVGSTRFPNLVRATNEASRSLTLFNASASQNTLTIMLIVALIGMPVVIGYTIFIYRTFSGPVRIQEEDGAY
jgi:cytochrome d ubiquinol oxidase subunit II